MSTSDIPRHDSVVNGHVGIVSTQPSTPPLTQKPAPALTSQQAPKPVQSGSRSQSQNSSVTETGDSDDEGSDLELDDNDVHFCQRCYVRYLLQIKWAFRDRLRVFSEMDCILTSYYDQRLMTRWVVLRVNSFLAGEPRLLDEFYRFLPLEFQR